MSLLRLLTAFLAVSVVGAGMPKICILHPLGQGRDDTDQVGFPVGDGNEFQ